MRESIVEPTSALSWPAAGLLFGVSRSRLTAAAVVLAMMPAAPHVPALASLVSLAVVLAVLNTHELMVVQQTGWRAMLRRPAVAADPALTARR
jgi:hypothetical protein